MARRPTLLFGITGILLFLTTVIITTSAEDINATPTDTCTNPQPPIHSFHQGHGIESLPDGRELKSSFGHSAAVLEDGSFTVTSKAGFVLWSSDVAPGKARGPYKLILQDDGNLVEYDKDGVSVWNTCTGGQGSPPYNFWLADNDVGHKNGTLLLQSWSSSPSSADGILWTNFPHKERKGKLCGFNIIYDEAWEPKTNINATTTEHSDDGVPFDESIFSSGTPQSSGKLFPGQCISSSDFQPWLHNSKALYAVLGQDGNFKLMKGSADPESQDFVWQSNSARGQQRGPYRLCMHHDGNVAIYDTKGEMTWNTCTFSKGSPPYVLHLQQSWSSSGDALIVQGNNQVLWKSSGNSK